jgi:hypothetical protein
MDLEGALAKLCPDVDWSFLDARLRNLSEKALETRQQEEAEAAERQAAAEGKLRREQERAAVKRAKEGQTKEKAGGEVVVAGVEGPAAKRAALADKPAPTD